MLSYSLKRLSAVEIQKVPDELIGMLRFYPVNQDLVAGKIIEIVGDDHVGMNSNSRRQHVPIVDIGKMQSLDQFLKARDQAIGHSPVHQPARALKLRDGQIGPIHKKIANPFVMNEVRPSGTKQIRLRQSEQEVA